VARRLIEMPLVRESFGRGEMSYSRVRALSRVATPELEESLVELARHATAAQLEVVLRAYRGVMARELHSDDHAHGDRYVICEHDDDGSLLIRARLPAQEGALVAAALESARDSLRAGAREARDAAVRGGEHCAREVPAAAAAADGEDGQDPVAHAEEELAEPSSPGRDVSAETPDGSSNVLDGTPPVDGDAFSAAAPPSNADALVLMAETLLDSAPADKCGGQSCQVVVHVDAEALAGERGDDESSEAGCHLEHGYALQPETVRRLACDSSVVRILERDGRPLSIGRRTRSVPPALRRALRARDHSCRFPGCSHRRFLHAHHVEHWARGGRTDLANLIHLCRYHHRLVHEGGYCVERAIGGELRFSCPDGRVITAVPEQQPGDRHELQRRHRRLGIGPDTCASSWNGDRLDLALAVDGLVSRDTRMPREGVAMAVS
jgi:hypothetical protein